MKAKEELNKKITKKCALLAVAQVSNVLGCVNPIKELADRVHKNGGVIVVDGAQSAPHMKVDVREMDVPSRQDWDYAIADEEKEKYNNDYNKFVDDIENDLMNLRNKINNQIESFLNYIDAKYKTHFARTGNQRIY